MAQWIDIFALSQFYTGKIKLPYGKRTIRIVVRNYLDGFKVRLTFANRYGENAIEISKATLARCDENGYLLEEPIVLTFNNESYGIVNAKSSLITDDIEYRTEKGYYAVSIYLKKWEYIKSLNMLREQVILSEHGDFASECKFDNANRIMERLFDRFSSIGGIKDSNMIPLLESFAIQTDDKNKSILAFGDSITQAGMWTYELSEKLELPVINLGISGNQLLKDSDLPIVEGLFGQSGIERFDIDVVTRRGAKAIIVLMGINDIIRSVSAKKEDKIKAQDIIDGLVNIAKRSKEIGLIAFIGTLTPIKYHKSNLEDALVMRKEINDWIKNNDVYDGYFDFEKMIRDEQDIEMLSEPYDSGDHLHPSDRGSIRMVDAIDIDLLRKI